MIRSLLLFLTVLFVGLLPMKVYSTHIVGGEMYYEKLGGNDYKITLIVYRDCFKGIPWFDNPAYISVFDTAYKRIKNLPVIPPMSDTLPLENYDSCTWVDTVCYEVVKYEVVTSLPPNPGGYILVYDRCCWNASVQNIERPLESGLAVVTTVPDTSLVQSNNSAIFKKRTPPFFCVNQLFEFDHSATDPDGDSLSYELFTPFNSSQMWNSHQAPLPGPYNELIYAPGYSLSNVLGGGIPLNINEISGYLSAKLDNKVGQFIFGVKVKEYRNGKLIGETSRSYQINSQYCKRYTRARFTEPIIQCGDSIVQFDNNSDSAKAYLWHFDDKNSNDSISILETPLHEYSSTGQYKVQLIAYSHQGNSCNDTITGLVQLYPDIVAEFTYEDEKCNNFVQFKDVTNSKSGAVIKWLWDFGDGKASVLPEPYHNYNLNDEEESFTVVMRVENSNGCKDTVAYIYTGKNRKYEINRVSATKYTIYPRGDSTLLTVDADSAVKYSWSPYESLSSPNDSKTYALPNERTLYTVQAHDGRGCFDEKTVEIDVHQYSCGATVVYVPNAFSPNGDGENDYLRVRGEEITYLKMSIFNRWGQLVFESEDHRMIKHENLGWDGSFNGVRQEPGVYVYQIEVQCSDNRQFTKKGNITLIQ